MIRWRQGAEGTPESNARVVEWEDGTYSLMVGDEAFSMSVHPIKGDNHLYVNHTSAGGAFLQGQGIITNKATFAPTGVDSRIHRRLSRAIVGRHRSTGPKVRVASKTALPHLSVGVGFALIAVANCRPCPDTCVRPGCDDHGVDCARGGNAAPGRGPQC